MKENKRFKEREAQLFRASFFCEKLKDRLEKKESNKDDKNKTLNQLHDFKWRYNIKVDRSRLKTLCQIQN